MQASDFHSDWYESELVRATTGPAPATVTALVALYGSKSAAAKAAGVSTKSIERYTRYEAGERGKDVRNPDAKPLTQAARKAREGVDRAKANAPLAARIAREGLTVTAFAGQMCVSGKCRDIDPKTPRQPDANSQHIPGKDLADYLDAMARGQWQLAAEKWDDAFFGNAYLVAGASLPDITRLDMEIG